MGLDLDEEEIWSKDTSLEEQTETAVDTRNLIKLVIKKPGESQKSPRRLKNILLGTY